MGKPSARQLSLIPYNLDLDFHVDNLDLDFHVDLNFSRVAVIRAAI